ncbi:hypothetical protein SAMN05216361_0117 [Marisediminitalea aggregata]|uniref:Uncharacterized protein n=1 Tax=Marisediminitalea aggregata TaxID=634436 RepID=A0A1M5SXY0_9ALTE|nr:hypothetical protein [Marisediminitalea aggregata]SHH43148.1 hypothetical protein SAMN05216361_0117 [Marisediminitalea aggregata]
MKELLQLARGISEPLVNAMLYGIADIVTMDDLLNINAHRLIIVEPDPVAFAKLEAWQSSMADSAIDIVCYHAVLDSEQVNVTLYQSSQLGFSSTESPNRIKLYRPGLKFTPTVVPAKPIDYFIAKYNILREEQNMLMLNCNGAEAGVLGLEQTENFNIIVVRTSNDPLYGSNRNNMGLSSGAGYCSLKQRGQQKPYINLLLQRAVGWQASQAQLLSLQKELNEEKTRNSQHAESKETLITDLEKSAALVEQLQASLSTVTQQNEDLSKQLESVREYNSKNRQWAESAESAKAKLDAELGALIVKTEELKNAISNLESENGLKEEKLSEVTQLQRSLEQKAGQLEKALEQSNHEKEELRGINATNCEKIIELTATNGRLKEEANRQANTISKLEEDQSALQCHLESLQTRELQASTTAKLNAKLLIKLQADLSHLRHQHEEKQKNVSELESLVAELHQKLQQAATFYHRLEREYPELLVESVKS